MNNIVDLGYETEENLKQLNIQMFIKNIVLLVFQIAVVSLLGQKLWNLSVPKLFPMVSKAGLYDVVFLHILLKLFF